MTLMGVVQNYSGLLATRFLLGLTEAPFFPGAMFILSNWYRREELQRRMAYLYAVSFMSTFWTKQECRLILRNTLQFVERIGSRRL
jgi:MFS family permease